MAFEHRRERLRHLLAERSLDALLVCSPSNRYYLSGFELHDVQFNESAGWLVVTREGRDYIITDQRYEEAALMLWAEDNLVIHRGDFYKKLNRVLGQSGLRIGVETAAMSAEQAATLAGLRRFEPANGLVERLRVNKDAEEISALKKSFALNHAMLAWVPEALKMGMTEQELSWKIECYFREHGASELAFPNIVAFGSNAALPHAAPTLRPLQENTGILLDIGCRVDSYCSDQTRSFWFGDQEDELFKTTRELVAEAQEKVLAAIEPGRPMAEVARLAQDVFKKAGVEEHFTHGLGHGVGLDTHEKPSFNIRSRGCFEPGMTVTVEPGLYYPGKLGVRLEVTVLVEEQGASVL